MNRSRRELLGGLGGALVPVATAGCLDVAAGDGPQGPAGTPEALSCPDEEFVRLDAPFSAPVESPTVETTETELELSAEGASETYGQSLRLVLRNTGDGPAATRGEHAYSIQRQTTGGWAEVRGSTTGEAVELPRREAVLEAGGTYSWAIELAEEPIESAVPDRDLGVCPPLGPGPHRFVYWGIVDAPPVGVEFELVG
jgi:hypothetical protein